MFENSQHYSKWHYIEKTIYFSVNDWIWKCILCEDWSLSIKLDNISKVWLEKSIKEYIDNIAPTEEYNIKEQDKRMKKNNSISSLGSRSWLNI